MKKIPKVSVCVITYNQEKYVEECIQSILNQETNYDYEIIIGDDGSNDSTQLILQKLREANPQKVKILASKKNQGASKNLLTVMAAANGEYIAHCDGDDFWERNKLEIQVRYLEKNKNISAVFSNAKTKKGKLNEVKNLNIKFDDAMSKIFSSSLFIRSSLIERRKDLTELINYEKNSSRKSIFDFEMYYVMLNGCNVSILGDTLVYYNDHSQGMSKKNTLFNEYRMAIDDLSQGGLDKHNRDLMVFDLKITRYFRDYDFDNRIGFLEYLRSRRCNLVEFVKILLPRVFAKWLKNFYRGLRA
jgi:glycosyltransferase involved in cell wall biosynthesis